MDLSKITTQDERLIRYRCSGRGLREIAAIERTTYSKVKGAMHRAYVKLGLSGKRGHFDLPRLCYQMGRKDGG